MTSTLTEFEHTIRKIKGSLSLSSSDQKLLSRLIDLSDNKNDQKRMFKKVFDQKKLLIKTKSIKQVFDPKMFYFEI